MKVLASRYLYKFRELLPENVGLDLFDPGKLPENVSNYDALFVNTTTPLNPKTLPETGSLTFIGTGSSGTDHLDLNYLHSQNIRTADAAGCNALSVAEYVITAILCHQQKTGLPFADFKVGLVGKGHVGLEVSRMLCRFSTPHLSYDPPKENRELSYNSAHFEELKECNILTFHTPITRGGEYPTYHLLNRSWFRGANYHLLINTSRGGVVDEQLVIEELDIGRLSSVVIDVWEDEPAFNTGLASRAFFATPHIAGYSRQSKLRASKMIINQFCRHADLPKPDYSDETARYVELGRDYETLDEILLDLHPIGSYDRSLRKLMDHPTEKRAVAFNKLRSETPLRDEFSFIQIDPKYLDEFPELGVLGIQPK